MRCHLFKRHLRRPLHQYLLRNRHRCDAFMVLDDLKCPRPSKRQHAGMMNGQHSILKTLVVFQHEYFEPHISTTVWR